MHSTGPYPNYNPYYLQQQQYYANWWQQYQQPGAYYGYDGYQTQVCRLSVMTLRAKAAKHAVVRLVMLSFSTRTCKAVERKPMEQRSSQQHSSTSQGTGMPVFLSQMFNKMSSFKLVLCTISVICCQLLARISSCSVVMCTPTMFTPCI